MFINQKLVAMVACAFAVSSAYAGEEQRALLPSRIKEYCQSNGNECQTLLKAMQEPKNCMNRVVYDEAFGVAKKANWSDSTAQHVARSVRYSATVGHKSFEIPFVESLYYTKQQ